ncbi:MAG: hypothetical protein K0S44_257 [Bacteroidetes bacterium]|jgi:hypothetical protein|nr:hypothetical protein [Bacteroidota bacterium]
MKRISPNNIQELEPNQVFVFGSNKEGKHYGGAARLAAEKFGAIMGNGHGLQGQSYAIDTMSGLSVIKDEVQAFISFAKVNPFQDFLMTEIGCGIAGYTPQDIAPLFQSALSVENIFLPESFLKILTEQHA